MLAPVPTPRRTGRKLLVVRANFVEIFFFEIFDVQEGVARGFRSPNKLVKLYVKCFRIAILGVLDQEHHQERDDGRACVDYQLPRVAKAK